MKLSEFLRAAKARIDTPEKWTKGAYARDRFDRHVSESSGYACKRCSVGALICEADMLVMQSPSCELYLRALRALERAIYRHGVDSLDITEFNDSHAHEEVMQLWDFAIAQAEKEEAAQ